MRVLFDITALYVAAGVSDMAFTPKVQRLLEHTETVRLVSPVSFNEIAIKAWIVVENTRVKRMPDIALRGHLNASESLFTVYRWTGANYKDIDCYIHDVDGTLSACEKVNTSAR